MEHEHFMQFGKQPIVNGCFRFQAACQTHDDTFCATWQVELSLGETLGTGQLDMRMEDEAPGDGRGSMVAGWAPPGIRSLRWL